MSDQKTVYDIYHERMEYAAQRTCSGDIAEAGCSASFVSRVETKKGPSGANLAVEEEVQS